MAVEHDEIGIWSEVKLAIIKEYASTYTKIMDAQQRERIPSLRWFYIDYRGLVHIDSKAGPADIPVSLVVNTVGPVLGLNFNGLVFESREAHWGRIEKQLVVYHKCNSKSSTYSDQNFPNCLPHL